MLVLSISELREHHKETSEVLTKHSYNIESVFTCYFTMLYYTVCHFVATHKAHALYQNKHLNGFELKTDICKEKDL